MNGTIMITGQTTGTLSVMLPYGRCTLYIIYRAHLGTLATLDTDILIHREFLVRNHPLVEVSANNVGVESGSGPLL